MLIGIFLCCNTGYSQITAKAAPALNVTPDMKLVESGSFQMGTSETSLIKKEMARGEMPAHNVDVDGFYIGIYEVTQKQWRDIMNDNPGKFKGCDDCPVESVSWWGAVKYCNYRSIKEGLTPCYSYKEETNPDNWPSQKYNYKKISCDINSKGYRLPTEAEWEFAAKGGNETKSYKYSGSDKIEEVAWYKANSDKKTHPVGEKKPNELGLYDMSGNVREWCNDWYDELYYSISPRNNPMGQDTGQYRVLRGGSWVDFKYSLGVTQRMNNPPESRDGFGFRVARTQ